MGGIGIGVTRDVPTAFRSGGDGSIETGSAPSRRQVGPKSAPSRPQEQLLEFARQERSFTELMEILGWRDRTKFRNKFVRPLIDAGWLSMTIPNKPRSSKQRYITTDEGLQVLAQSRGNRAP